MAYPKKWLSCFKAGHRATSREFIDEELAIKMLERWKKNPEDKEAIEVLDYLAQFNAEFHKDVFAKNKPRLNGDQVVEGQVDSKGRPLTYRKDCQQRNDARNRDIMSREYRFLQSYEDINQGNTPENEDNED